MIMVKIRTWGSTPRSWSQPPDVAGRAQLLVMETIISKHACIYRAGPLESPGLCGQWMLQGPAQLSTDGFACCSPPPGGFRHACCSLGRPTLKPVEYLSPLPSAPGSQWTGERTPWLSTWVRAGADSGNHGMWWMLNVLRLLQRRHCLESPSEPPLHFQPTLPPFLPLSAAALECSFLRVFNWAVLVASMS